MTLTTTYVVSIDSNITSYGQMTSSGQQDMPTMGVKITSPSNDEKVAIGGNFKVTGSSTDTANVDCKVSVILNNVKPYQEAGPTGPGGKSDYSTWNFVLTPNYNATIKEGTNKITSKLSCPNPNENASSALATHYSVFFAGEDSSISSSPSVNTTATTGAVSISRQEEPQQISPSIATLETPSQDNETIIQLSDSAPSDDADDRLDNTKKEAATAATSVAESSSIATPTVMTFTIYQEGKLESSSAAKQDATTTQSIDTTSSTSPSLEIPMSSSVSTCDQNLPISRFSSIGDDGDDAIPQNAFDNNLDTRWSHDSMGSWIIVDLGTIKDICSVDIAWYRGDERSYDFVISFSDDGTNFKDLLEGTSRGDTLSPERYKVTGSASAEEGSEIAVSARYIKITINGNNDADNEENQWGAITEVDVNGRQSDKENIGTITQTPTSQSTPSSTTESGETMIMQISGSYEQNSRDNSQSPRIDPSRLEGRIAVIDSATNKKVLEYDLAPINITFTQLFKKVTVKAGIDDPIRNGNVTSTMKFSSPIDVQKAGSYTSNLTATDAATTESAGGNMLLAKIDGEQTFLTRENTKGSITIRSP
jgi:F5/8 type C domain